jgi:hypothetical protein
MWNAASAGSQQARCPTTRQHAQASRGGLAFLGRAEFSALEISVLFFFWKSDFAERGEKLGYTTFFAQPPSLRDYPIAALLAFKG